MPPKARISKEMILETGLRIIRTEGAEHLNVRRIAAVLDCSTQPVMYHYSTVNDLKHALYAAADALHTEFIMTPDASAENPLLSIGLRYIRFAEEEKHLFRFLFQSDQFQNTSFRALTSRENIPFIQPLCDAAGLHPAQGEAVFAVLFTCVHGAASLIANNSLEYDEAYFAALLERTFYGAVKAVTEESK